MNVTNIAHQSPRVSKGECTRLTIRSVTLGDASTLHPKAYFRVEYSD